MRPRSLAPLLLLAFSIAACDLPEPSEFPAVRLLADPAAAALFDPPQLDHYAKLEGTRIELDSVPSDALEQRIAGAGNHDIVATSDPVLWHRLLESGAVAPAPWRFAARRETILIVVPASASATDELPLPIALLGAGSGDLDPLAGQVLIDRGLWDRARGSALSAQVPADLVGMLRSGRAASAPYRASPPPMVPADQRIQHEADPHTGYPGFMAMGVLGGISRPIPAHRTFLQLRQTLGTSELTYVTR